MDDEADTTYRLIALANRELAGNTAATPELAVLVPGNLINLDRTSQRLAMERTEWENHFGKPRVQRSTVIGAENHPGEWRIGA